MSTNWIKSRPQQIRYGLGAAAAAGAAYLNVGANYRELGMRAGINLASRIVVDATLYNSLWSKGKVPGYENGVGDPKAFALYMAGRMIPSALLSGAIQYFLLGRRDLIGLAIEGGAVAAADIVYVMTVPDQAGLTGDFR